MLSLIAAALACEPTVLARFTPPAEPPPELTIDIARARHQGNAYTGAHVTFRSASPVTAWQRVLEHPELQDEWHPEELGTERVERIWGTNFYQRTGITILGAITIRRQLIAQVRWLESGAKLLRTCWSAGDPEAYDVAAWDEGSAWQQRGMGSWDIAALPDGGSRVAYQVWISADFLPSSTIAWAVSRTLPTLLNAFDARAAELERETH